MVCQRLIPNETISKLSSIPLMVITQDCSIYQREHSHTRASIIRLQSDHLTLFTPRFTSCFSRTSMGVSIIPLTNSSPHPHNLHIGFTQSPQATKLFRRRRPPKITSTTALQTQSPSFGQANSQITTLGIPSHNRMCLA